MYRVRQFLSLIKLHSQRGHSKNYLKKGLDWIFRNLFLLIEHLMIGTPFQRIVWHVVRYVVLNNKCLFTWNRKL